MAGCDGGGRAGRGASSSSSSSSSTGIEHAVGGKGGGGGWGTRTEARHKNGYGADFYLSSLVASRRVRQSAGAHGARRAPALRARPRLRSSSPEPRFRLPTNVLPVAPGRNPTRVSHGPSRRQTNVYILPMGRHMARGSPCRSGGIRPQARCPSGPLAASYCPP